MIKPISYRLYDKMSASSFIGIDNFLINTKFLGKIIYTKDNYTSFIINEDRT